VRKELSPWQTALGTVVLFGGANVIQWLSGVGLNGPWFIGAVVAVVVVAVESAYATYRAKELVGLTLPWLGVAALLGVIAGAFAWAIRLEHDVEQANAQVAQLKADVKRGPPGRRTFDFIVTTSDDPNNYSSTPGDAIERIQPDLSAAQAINVPAHDVGTHVSVLCGDAPSGNAMWFKLADGNFMAAMAIQPSPDSGESSPPVCPGAEG
jgi:hypothetical protein